MGKFKYSYTTAKKGFVILTIAFVIRIETVGMVLRDNTRIVPCGSQLCVIHHTWSTTTIEEVCL